MPLGISLEMEARVPHQLHATWGTGGKEKLHAISDRTIKISSQVLKPFYHWLSGYRQLRTSFYNLAGSHYVRVCDLGNHKIRRTCG